MPAVVVSSPRPYLRAELRRNQLLEAADRLFARSGYAGITMQAVAAEAGVSRRLVYDHFSDVSTLLTEGRLERDRVAPQVRRHRDLLSATAREEGARPQVPSQEVHRLAKGRPCGRRVEVGPEEGEEGVGAPVAVRPGEGKVRQEPHALGLGQDLVEGRSRLPLQIDRSEDAEPAQAVLDVRVTLG